MVPERGERNEASQFEDDNELSTVKTKQDKFWPRVWADLRDMELLPLKILFFVKSGTVFVLYPYLTLLTKSLGLHADKAGISNAVTIINIVGQPLAGVLSDKIGNFKVFLAVITFLASIPALLLTFVPPAREILVLSTYLPLALDCQTNSNDGFPGASETNVSAILNFTFINEDECIPINETNTQNRKYFLDSIKQVQCGKICDEKIDKASSFDVLTQLPVQAGKKYHVPGTTKKYFISTESKSRQVRCALHGFAGEEAVCTVDFNRNLASHWEFMYENSLAALPFTTESVPQKLRSCQQVRVGSKGTCSSRCIALFERKKFCQNSQIEKVYDEELTFWLFNVLRVTMGLLSATSWILFEGAVLAITKERNGDYGLQKASSFVAAIVAAPLSGYMIHYYNDFRPAIYLYTALQTMCAVITLFINLEFRRPAKQVFGNLWKVIKQVEVICLLVAVLFSGIAWGFLESFLFWFLQNLGGSELLMGLTITVGGLAGLPFLIVNKPIIDKFGHANIIALGLFFYGVRLLGYSFIIDPWMCLPLEALEAITASLAITAANTYAAQLADSKTVVSIQGIVGTVYYIIGKAVGSYIGGVLINDYDERKTYLVFAIVSFVSGFIYMVVSFLYQLYQTRNQSFRNINLPQASQENNKLQGLKFDGGYVGPFTQVDARLSNQSTEVP